MKTKISTISCLFLFTACVRRHIVNHLFSGHDAGSGWTSETSGWKRFLLCNNCLPLFCCWCLCSVGIPPPTGSWTLEMYYMGCVKRKKCLSACAKCAIKSSCHAQGLIRAFARHWYNLMILLADNAGSDQCARMRKLIRAFAVRICQKTGFRIARSIFTLRIRTDRLE